MHSREKNSKFETRNSKILRFAPQCQPHHRQFPARLFQENVLRGSALSIFAFRLSTFT